MSDISKAWQLTAQLEARREFRFESGLARFMRRTMYENEKTLSDVAKATRLTVVQISNYRSDYRYITKAHAEKLSKYFTDLTGEEIPPGMLIHWQSVGYPVNLEEGRQMRDAFLDDIEEAVKNG